MKTLSFVLPLLSLLAEAQGAPALDPRLLEPTPVATQYVEARRTASKQNDPRIAEYERRWRAAEDARDEANGLLREEIARLERASGDRVDRATLFAQPSQLTRVALTRYLAAWKASLDVWTVEGGSRLQWKDDGQPEASVKVATDLDRARSIAAQQADRAQERKPVEPDEVTQKIESVSLDGAISQVIQTSPVQPPISVPPGGPATPGPPLPGLPPNGPALPPNGSAPPSAPPNGTAPPPNNPVPPQGPVQTPPSGGPSAPPPGLPGGPPGGGSPLPAGCDLEYPLTPQQANDLLVKAIAGDYDALLTLNRANCWFYWQLETRCPAEYQELKDAYEAALRQNGLTGNFKDFTCPQIGPRQPSTPPPSTVPPPASGGGGRQTKAAVMVVGQCQNGGFECRESDARPVELCVDYPAGATLYDFKTQIKWVEDSTFGNCGVGGDCAWSRFLAAGRRGNSQFCTQFVNWSHARRRVIRLQIEYEEKR